SEGPAPGPRHAVRARAGTLPRPGVTRCATRPISRRCGARRGAGTDRAPASDAHARDGLRPAHAADARVAGSVDGLAHQTGCVAQDTGNGKRETGDVTASRFPFPASRLPL